VIAKDIEPKDLLNKIVESWSSDI